MEICNVVATATLKSPLDLERMLKRLPGAEFNKSTRHWLKYRLSSDNRYIAFYKSGKFIITGSGVFEKFDDIINQVVDIIRSTGEDADVVRVDVNNIVCKDRIKLTKSLDAIYSALSSDNIEYEPEQFPAIIYKNWGVSFLLFSSGSLMVAGAKDVDTATKGIQQFRKLLKKI